MSALLTPEMCQRAWNIVSVAVDMAAANGVTNKYAGTIVVLDPTYYVAPTTRPGNGVLFQANINGGRHSDGAHYEQIALAKAHLSQRTGQSSRYIQETAPHLYKEPINREPGDIKFGGSVVREGLVVAFSGVQAVYDEWIAGMMADLLIAMCRDEMTKPDGIMASNDWFVDRNRHGQLAALMSQD